MLRARLGPILRNQGLRPPCLRHDFTWRTLAVIDQGTGRIWNQRNRWVADKTFQLDAFAGCNATYATGGVWGNRRIRGCNFSVGVFYTFIRSWLFDQYQRPDERVSTTAQPYDYIPFPSVTARIDCTVRGNTNRCLPIHYLEVDGRSFIPRNTPYIVRSRVIKMYAVRANLQAPGGPPTRTSPIANTVHYAAVGELAIMVNWPLRASTVESGAVCPSSPRHRGQQTIYVRYKDYVPGVTPPDEDDTLKKVPFYVISCASTTTAQEKSALLDFRRMEATYSPTLRKYITKLGQQVRTYEEVRSKTCPGKTGTRMSTDSANRITLSYTGEGYSYGSWTSMDCQYRHATIKPYIDYHLFIPARTYRAVIDLEYRNAPVDPSLYLHQISTSSGNLQILSASDDNGDGDNRNSRVTRTLTRGVKYIAGVTLHGNGKLGDYRLRIGTKAACVIIPVDRQSNQTSVYISDEWTTMDCISSRRANSYADHFMFELGGTTNRRVTIDVKSTEGNPYIFLIKGDSIEGTGYLYKDNNSGRLRNDSRISASLTPGPYILVVSTYGEHETGEYSVSITGPDSGR